MARQLSSAFFRYERDRVAFVSSCADMARQEGNTASLVELGAPRLLLPLLDDPVETVAHTAAFALGRLAGHSSAVASMVAHAGVVATQVERLKQQGKPEGGDAAACAAKRAAMGLLVALTRHSAELAGTVVEQGGVAAALACMKDQDAEVREGAVWTLAHLTSRTEELAAHVHTAGALPLLVDCLEASPASAAGDGIIKRVAASALSDAAKHSAALAAAVVEAGPLPAIVSLLRQPLNNDARLKRQLLCMLMHVCKADAGLATAVVGAGLVADISRCLKFSDDTVRRHAASCLRDIVVHNADLASNVASVPGALEALACYSASASPSAALPALLAFGLAAGHSVELAAAPGAVPAVVAALQCGDKHSQAAAAWALGRIGRHTAELAEQATPGLTTLCTLASSAPAGSDLATKCLKAATAIVAQLADVTQLAGLLMQSQLDPGLQQLLLSRCAALMAKQPASRAAFATSGALAHLTTQAEALPADSAQREHIAACLRLFPEELVNHYSPGYQIKLLAQLDVDPPPADAIAAVPAAAPTVEALPAASAEQQPEHETCSTPVATAPVVDEEAVAVGEMSAAALPVPVEALPAGLDQAATVQDVVGSGAPADGGAAVPAAADVDDTTAAEHAAQVQQASAADAVVGGQMSAHQPADAAPASADRVPDLGTLEGQDAAPSHAPTAVAEVAEASTSALPVQSSKEPAAEEQEQVVNQQKVAPAAGSGCELEECSAAAAVPAVALAQQADAPDAEQAGAPAETAEGAGGTVDGQAADES